MSPITRAFRWQGIAAGASAAAALLIMPAPMAAVAAVPLFPPASEVSPPPDVNSSASTFLLATACTGNGACVAGGSYRDRDVKVQAWVVRESHGRWGPGIKLRMPRQVYSPNPGGQVTGIACVKAGRCYAVGSYNAALMEGGAFIATEANGRWRRAAIPAVPANAAAAPQATLQDVACLPTGFCEAVGSYQDTHGRSQAFAISKPAGGKWQRPVEIRAPKGAATNPNVLPHGIACVSAGKCMTVGDYDTAASVSRAMGAVEVRGSWRRAVRIALPSGAVAGDQGRLNGIACRSRRCIAVGDYGDGVNDTAMWAAESKGRFGHAKRIIARPPDGHVPPVGTLTSVSCPRTGPCVAAGSYLNTSGHSTAWYLTRSSGSWLASTLLQPPDATTGSAQSSTAYSVSCTGAGHCTTVGDYSDLLAHIRAEAASSG